MNRRQFVGALSGMAAAWPLRAHGQQPIPLIGYLGSTSADEPRHAAFRRGLAEHGLTEGQDLKIEFLWAHGQYDRLPPLVADFQRRGATMIFASGNQAALAAKSANIAGPVVFVIGDDPVRLDLVGSLNRPLGNITGVTFYSAALVGKRLGLLHEMVPRDATIAVIANPISPGYQEQLAEARVSARTLGRSIEHFDARTPEELDGALAAIVQRHTGGFLYTTDPFFNAQRQRLVDFAARERLPAIFSGREYIEVGASIAYGANIFDAFREGGSYVGRILKGAKPADLPVLQPTKFELIFNLKSANALGMSFPPTLLALADEVIE